MNALRPDQIQYHPSSPDRPFKIDIGTPYKHKPSGPVLADLDEAQLQVLYRAESPGLFFRAWFKHFHTELWVYDPRAVENLMHQVGLTPEPDSSFPLIEGDEDFRLLDRLFDLFLLALITHPELNARGTIHIAIREAWFKGKEDRSQEIRKVLGIKP